MKQCRSALSRGKYRNAALSVLSSMSRKLWSTAILLIIFEASCTAINKICTPFYVIAVIVGFCFGRDGFDYCKIKLRQHPDNCYMVLLKLNVWPMSCSGAKINQSRTACKTKKYQRTDETFVWLVMSNKVLRVLCQL